MKKHVSAFALGLLPLAMMAAAAPNLQGGVADSLATPAPATVTAPADVVTPSLPIPSAYAGYVPAAPSAAHVQQVQQVPKIAPMASSSHRRGRARAADLNAPPLIVETSSSEHLALGSSPTLTAQEQAALAIARRWKESSASNGLNSVAGPDGTVRFLFGASQPSVVCAVFQVCDVELQRGETVNAVHLGDAARWVVEPAISGSGATEVMHLVIKPMDVDLETTLMVATNRRTYHLRLRSHRSEFVPRVAFIYPEEAAAKWDAITKREATEKADATIPSTGESVNELSFDYRVEGSAKWKPLRVYNNGQKTFIQMPASMAASEAPTLLLVRKGGGILSDEETAMVNYRVQNDRFVVDALFDKAILIAGVGASQDRITITRGK